MRFNVEETNLMSIYHTGARAETMAELTAALPHRDDELEELFRHTLDKLFRMSDAEFAQLTFELTDEDEAEA